MTCLLCLTSGLIKEKHHRPRFHKTHWSTIAGGKWWVKFITKNSSAQTKTHSGVESDTRTSGHYWLFTNSARRHFRGQMCVEKDGCWLSLQGWQKKREGWEKSQALQWLEKPSQSWYLERKSGRWKSRNHKNRCLHFALEQSSCSCVV